MILKQYDYERLKVCFFLNDNIFLKTIETTKIQLDTTKTRREEDGTHYYH